MVEKNFTEMELRKIVKKLWRGWIDWLEPRGNAGIGRPDMDIIVNGIIAPVELKIGKMVENAYGINTFRIERMRPDQVSWHWRFHSAGGTSYFLIADSPTDMWLVSKMAIMPTKPYYGFYRAYKIDVNQFVNNMEVFIEAWRRK